jgi:hypothetical protein
MLESVLLQRDPSFAAAPAPPAGVPLPQPEPLADGSCPRLLLWDEVKYEPAVRVDAISGHV